MVQIAFYCKVQEKLCANFGLVHAFKYKFNYHF